MTDRRRFLGRPHPRTRDAWGRNTWRACSPRRGTRAGIAHLTGALELACSRACSSRHFSLTGQVVDILVCALVQLHVDVAPFIRRFDLEGRAPETSRFGVSVDTDATGSVWSSRSL